ncbi:MAG: hypothetical protein ACRDY7_02305 [Acidimicrobiia bacterium]
MTMTDEIAQTHHPVLIEIDQLLSALLRETPGPGATRMALRRLDDHLPTSSPRTDAIL